jgi:mannose-6-phosphate isomerase-like protein (cupin superfamily)
MEIFNKSNTKNTGALPIQSSWMLIGSQNTRARAISMQISEIPAGSEQPVHSHLPERCYYIIKGRGLMIMEDEAREVSAGDAVYVPSNKKHGMKNLVRGVLEYLTANSPPLGHEYENKLWPGDPVRKR